MQLKLSALIFSISALALTGCASSNIKDPVALGNGIFLVSSYGPSVTEVKRELLSKAIEFCSDDNLAMHVESTHVTTQDKMRDGTDDSGEVGSLPGSVELTFSCRKDH